MSMLQYLCLQQISTVLDLLHLMDQILQSSIIMFKMHTLFGFKLT